MRPYCSRCLLDVDHSRMYNRSTSTEMSTEHDSYEEKLAPGTLRRFANEIASQSNSLCLGMAFLKLCSVGISIVPLVGPALSFCKRGGSQGAAYLRWDGSCGQQDCSRTRPRSVIRHAYLGK